MPDSVVTWEEVDHRWQQLCVLSPSRRMYLPMEFRRLWDVSANPTTEFAKVNGFGYPYKDGYIDFIPETKAERVLKLMRETKKQHIDGPTPYQFWAGCHAGLQAALAIINDTES
jgi:hypothetical protein